VESYDGFSCRDGSDGGARGALRTLHTFSALSGWTALCRERGRTPARVGKLRGSTGRMAQGSARKCLLLIARWPPHRGWPAVRTRHLQPCVLASISSSHRPVRVPDSPCAANHFSLRVVNILISVVPSPAALCALEAGDMLNVYIHGILVQLRTPVSIRGRVSAPARCSLALRTNWMSSSRMSRRAGSARSGSCHWGDMLTLEVVGNWTGLFPELRKLD
jgi:hypothetical protein